MPKFNKGEVWFIGFPLEKDDSIFLIGNLHPDDLNEIEKQYIAFMESKKATS